MPASTPSVPIARTDIGAISTKTFPKSLLPVFPWQNCQWYARDVETGTRSRFGGLDGSPSAPGFHGTHSRSRGTYFRHTALAPGRKRPAHRPASARPLPFRILRCSTGPSQLELGLPVACRWVSGGGRRLDHFGCPGTGTLVGGQPGRPARWRAPRPRCPAPRGTRGGRTPVAQPAGNSRTQSPGSVSRRKALNRRSTDCLTVGRPHSRELPPK